MEGIDSPVGTREKYNTTYKGQRINQEAEAGRFSSDGTIRIASWGLEWMGFDINRQRAP